MTLSPLARLARLARIFLLQARLGFLDRSLERLDEARWLPNSPALARAARRAQASAFVCSLLALAVFIALLWGSHLLVEQTLGDSASLGEAFLSLLIQLPLMALSASLILCSLILAHGISRLPSAASRQTRREIAERARPALALSLETELLRLACGESAPKSPSQRRL